MEMMEREEFVQSECQECHRALWEKDGPICLDCRAIPPEATPAIAEEPPRRGRVSRGDTGLGADESSSGASASAPDLVGDNG